MKSLVLIEIDPTPCFEGRCESRKTVAISSSYKAFENYCKETLGSVIGKTDNSYIIYYEIQPSNVVIVQENNNRFNK